MKTVKKNWEEKLKKIENSEKNGNRNLKNNLERWKKFRNRNLGKNFKNKKKVGNSHFKRNWEQKFKTKLETKIWKIKIGNSNKKLGTESLKKLKIFEKNYVKRCW